jgi:DHA1 family multidrug resistance protein-like MFS transporter
VLIGLTYGNVAVLMAVQTYATPRHRLGIAIGTIQAVVPFASGVGPLLGSFVINTLGLRQLFAIDLLLVAVSGSILLLLIREPLRERMRGSVGSQVVRTLRVAWTAPSVRWIYFSMFFLLCGITAVQPYIPLLLAQYYAGEELTWMIGLVFASGSVATVILTPLFGVWGDRVGHDRLTTPSMVGITLLHGLLVIASGPIGLVSLLMLRNIPNAGTMGTLNTSLAIRAPEKDRGAMMSLAPFPRNLAMFVGPSAAAAVVGFGYPALFALSTAWLAAGTVTAYLLNRSLTSAERA